VRVAVFSTKTYDRTFLEAVNAAYGHDLEYFEPRLTRETVALAAGFDALKEGKIGYLGLDVYEEEADLFFEDLSGRVLQDDVFARLLTFPNVLITGHQAFFTREALASIAETTLHNLSEVQRGAPTPHEVTLERVVR
jgi:lactate dehydrogenase-like 2-hydroxyacid dehydrogenase